MKHTPQRMANEVSLVMNSICRPGFLGINPGRLEGYRQMELADTLRIDVKKMNSECGSRKRKALIDLHFPSEKVTKFLLLFA